MPDNEADNSVATRYFGTVEKYDEEEKWSNYTERMEQFFLLNEVSSDKKKVALFLSSVGPKVYALLKNLLAPSKPSEKSFQDLSKILSDYYEPEPLIIAERFKFNKREQKDGESMQEFYAALRELSKSCEYGTFLEEAIRDKFVCGMRNTKIQRRLLSESKFTAEQALKLATSWELSNLDQELPKETVFQVNRSTCYRCGGSNHSQDRCRFRNSTCFTCNSLGHISRMCQSSRPTKSFTNKPSNKPRLKKASVHKVQEESEAEEEENLDHDLNWLGLVNSVREEPFMTDLLINGKSVLMEVDTGAAVG